ncbi:Potassium voltage-gated channel subfamily F member 1 [Aphelenchoides bicaudatus]|nr:Potassium voltage-gated channel subfamily F member 1 [Aphelenchoides bicaudatus]
MNSAFRPQHNAQNSHFNSANSHAVPIKPPSSLLTLNADPTQNNPILTLNVGGSVYKIKESSIKRDGVESRLAYFVQQPMDKRLHLCDAYFTVCEEYFFERSSKLFDSIYKFYVTGQLHRPYDVCESEFLAELQFWRLPESLIATCCQPQFDLIDDSLDDLSSSKKRQNENIRQRLHRFCEGDGTLMSTIFTFVSICFVLISVLGLVLGSIEEFQIPYRRVGNQTVVASNVSKSRSPPDVTWEPNPAFGYVEVICVIWFTIEYVLRLVVTPNRLVFMRGILNIVDLIAIFPFYLELVLSIFGFDVDNLQNIKGAFLVVRIMRVLRVVRILKLSRYSTGMRTFALTLRSSARQLGMMGMFTGVIFFSTLLYFVEKDDPHTPFTSIPNAFWWAIVTMSTVGYGDQIPQTILGKTIASGAILSGVLVLALPITVIVDNFMKVSGSVQPRPAIHRPRPAQSIPGSPNAGEKAQLTST